MEITKELIEEYGPLARQYLEMSGIDTKELTEYQCFKIIEDAEAANVAE